MSKSQNKISLGDTVRLREPEWARKLGIEFTVKGLFNNANPYWTLRATDSDSVYVISDFVVMEIMNEN